LIDRIKNEGEETIEGEKRDKRNRVKEKKMAMVRHRGREK